MLIFQITQWYISISKSYSYRGIEALKYRFVCIYLSSFFVSIIANSCYRFYFSVVVFYDMHSNFVSLFNLTRTYLDPIKHIHTHTHTHTHIYIYIYMHARTHVLLPMHDYKPDYQTFAFVPTPASISRLDGPLDRQMLTHTGIRRQFYSAKSNAQFAPCQCLINQTVNDLHTDSSPYSSG